MTDREMFRLFMRVRDIQRDPDGEHIVLSFHPEPIVVEGEVLAKVEAKAEGRRRRGRQAVL